MHPPHPLDVRVGLKYSFFKNDDESGLLIGYTATPCLEK